MAAGHGVGPVRWEAEADRLLGRVAGRFGRVKTRRRARGFLLGLLAELPPKNLGREPEPGERRPVDVGTGGSRSTHPPSLLGRNRPPRRG
jgi:hypothetical protein